MKILLTNDDGIYAEGIITLAKVLREAGHELLIVAPDRERSATGHSISIHNPLRAQEIKLSTLEDVRAFKINGTPADCVKLGLEKFFSQQADLLISGINHGKNLGYDVLYSGTVSAAIEGFMMGYNSLAVSLDLQQKRNFQLAASFILEFLEDLPVLLQQGRWLLNINIPDLTAEEVKGWMYTSLGQCQYEDSYEERTDPGGESYYWLTGSIDKSQMAKGTDIWAVENNFLSITPLKLELTDYQLLEKLKKEKNR